MNQFRHTMEGIRTPEFDYAGPGDWINSEPLHIKELLSEAAVVLVDFWDYTCVNCIRTLPYLREWWRKYKDKGLVIVGVHTPEFAFARERANVEQAMSEFGIEYPVLLDPNYENWSRFANRYWPRKYLIDPKGFIVYDHAGEGAYGETEAKIQEMIRAKYPDTELPPLMEPLKAEDVPGAVCYPMTPELYTGVRRGRFANREECHPETVVEFTDMLHHYDGEVTLKGPWTCYMEYVRYAKNVETPEDYVLVLYHALEVNAVMRSETGKESIVYVTQNDKPVSSENSGEDIELQDGRSIVRVKESRMYRLIRNVDFGSYELKLYPTTDDFEIYAFTFGSCEEPDL